MSLQVPQGTVEIPLRVALRCRTLPEVAIGVAGGVGMAPLPEAVFADPAFANVLRPVLTEFPLRESTLYLVYSGRKLLPFKTRALIDLVLESASGNQEPTRTVLALNRTSSREQERGGLLKLATAALP